ncbi:hypothetical protein M7775_18950 [Sporomusa sphaeroides DSM 2875]|uniref:flagellar hook capping FlgD N-terminal domain-containing protein n=1 Tax=Sporomusa sphaeroides TaxID=47679 RepID=UPI0020304C92|nr:flagellar hook capping FlgD N-terminal domain-containing protein [Sporomusa sphaeroides]MCM0760631.1 hypothetical protein [Sporomusa sphaeroides DSM 2875]
MSINSVSGSTAYWSAPTSTSTSSTDNSTFGDFQSFLQLLATELQYQDPEDPVDSTEYVSQMAQFTSLNQLQTISNSVDAAQAYDLIGKTVTYTALNASGNTVSTTGKVDSVTISGGTPYLNIGGTKVAISAVTEVAAGGSTDSTAEV